MKTRLFCAMAVVVALGAAVQAQSVARAPASGRDKFIGAWRLVSLQLPDAHGKVVSVPGLKGTLIYTCDGHMSVQIMYPRSEAALSNDYVLNGYEASFGSYEVDEAKHTVTHHVQGSITQGLVGKTLERHYRFSDDGQLIITSARSDEHWSVLWEHY